MSCWALRRAQALRRPFRKDRQILHRVAQDDNRRICHSERSEESVPQPGEILRLVAQDDNGRVCHSEWSEESVLQPREIFRLVAQG